MVPEVEKPRVTEIQVRMDCNGCVQKIKKALQGISGIYDLYIDFPQQKLTVVGWADPEKIVKAIKKTRKGATICSHSDPSESPPPSPNPAPPPETTPPADPAANNNPPPPPAETPQAEAAPPPVEPPPPPPENPAPDVPSQPEAADPPPKPPRDVEEIHIIHHHPRSYDGYGNHWNMYAGTTSGGFRREVPPYYQVTHSYNTNRPLSHATEYEYLPPSPPQNVRFMRVEQYVGGYQYDGRGNGGGDGNNIVSIFSDENPNACRIA